jgi:hypothetical protein
MFMDAVQDVAGQDSAEMRHDIDTTRSAMADKLEALEDRIIGAAQSAKDAVASVKRTFDIKHHVEQRPWTIVGGCFLDGLAVTFLIPKGRSQTATTPTHNGSVTPAEKTPSLPAEPPRGASVFEPFQEEIDKVKGIAIGYVMGLVRDSIKESVPQMGSNIDELMNGITTKLGGEPVRAHAPDARNSK